MQRQREIGVIGLGRIGGGLALHAIERGMRVVGFDRKGSSDPVRRAGVVASDSIAALRVLLAPPRSVFLYVPAGPVVDDVLAELVDALEPILLELAVDGGYVHAEPSGAGHFTKLVHNGIEFGMLEAIAEGVDLLEHHPDRLAVADALRCWRHGSVIRSWLIDLLEAEHRVRGTGEVPPYVEDTGEVNWLVADALRMERPIPVIAQAVMQLFASRDAEKSWARAIAMMRHRFGGHPYGADDDIRRERRVGRVDS